MRIREIADPRQVDQLRNLIYNKVKEKFEKYSFWAALKYISDFVPAAGEWPEILELIAQHKTEIIKGTLESIIDPQYDSYTIYTILELIENLHNAGITWHELNTIKTSIQHDAKVRGLNI